MNDGAVNLNSDSRTKGRLSTLPVYKVNFGSDGDSNNTQSKQYKANSTKPLRLLLDTTKLEIH